MINILDRWVPVLRQRKILLAVSSAEFLLLTGLYLFFIVKDRVPLVGFLALALLWLFRRLAAGHWSIATPLDVPLVCLLLMLGVSLYISTDWSLSLPKVYGTVLGIAIYYAVVNVVTSERRLKLAVAALILLAGAVALVGLIGTDWVNSKVFTIPFIYSHLPRLVNGLARSVNGGFQHNIVGGTLIYFIPLLAALLWNRRTLDLSGLCTSPRLQGLIRKLQLPVLILSLVVVVSTLILTQSRGSFLGVGVALLVLAVWVDRRFLWSLPVLIAVVLVLMKVLGAANLLELLTSMDSFTAGQTLPVRMQVWQRAILLIRDFPFTGVGIGTFYPVTQVLYPLFDITKLVPHAHNIVLTTAVDVGIPGLVIYSALLSGFGFAAWKAYRHLDKLAQVILIGLACGMLAHLVYGIMDSFELGTKSGAVLWIFLGLAAALYVNERTLAARSGSASPEPSMDDPLPVSAIGSKRSGAFLHRFGWLSLVFVFWILIFLFSIAFVETLPYISLVIALLGGIVLGFVSVRTVEIIKSPPQNQVVIKNSPVYNEN